MAVNHKVLKWIQKTRLYDLMGVPDGRAYGGCCGCDCCSFSGVAVARLSSVCLALRAVFVCAFVLDSDTFPDSVGLRRAV